MNEIRMKILEEKFESLSQKINQFIDTKNESKIEFVKKITSISDGAPQKKETAIKARFHTP